MKCEKYLPLLELHLDGELDEHMAALVSAHLSACAPCAQAQDNLRREQDFFLGYECDVKPAPSFWEGVMARIAEEKNERAGPFMRLRHWLSGAAGIFNTPRLSPTLTIVLVLASVGITVGIMRHLSSTSKANDFALGPPDASTVFTPPPSSPDQVEVASSTAESIKEADQLRKTGKHDRRHDAGPNRVGMRGKAAPSARREGVKPPEQQAAARRREPTPDELVREAERKYRMAIALLSRDVRKRRSELDPETAARFRQTLAAIDRTIAGTSRAVREHPSDPVAAQYMLTAYAKKIEILRQMASH